MKRAMANVLTSFCLLAGVTAAAVVQRDRSSARANSPSPSPTPPRNEDIPLVRPGVILPPPLWANKIKNPHVRYVASSALKTFPVPAVIFRRQALAREDDWTEIRERIIYPSVNKSEKPIAAVVVEYFRDRPYIGVTLIWHGAGPTGKTNYSTAAIERDSSGHFPIGSYLSLFSDEN